MKTLKLIIPVILMLLVSACEKNDTGTDTGKPGKGTSLTIMGTNRVEGAMNDSLVIVGQVLQLTLQRI